MRVPGAARATDPKLWLEGLRARRIARRLAGPKLLSAFADAYPDAFFIEIGANDGVAHDHLRPFVLSHGWRGVMVEPVPFVFERLRRNYAGVEGVALANAAIARRDGTLPFYHLAEAGEGEREGLPGWYDAIGSFSRETVLAHAADIPDIERRLVSARVECLSFESLCRRHGVERLDLLAIDAEGYDAEIVGSIDFERRRPRLLIYEHFHLRPAERAGCGELLAGAGYETVEEHFDTFCLDASRDDSLTRAWRRLRPALPGVSVHEAR